MAGDAPLVSFGLLSDVQYADVDDGWNFHRTAQRFYRNALPQLHAAVGEWLRVASSAGADAAPLAFAVNLGDLIDGKNKMVGTSQAAFERAMAAWAPFLARVGPVHHLVGNHELYNFPPRELHRQLLWWRRDATTSAASSSSDDDNDNDNDNDNEDSALATAAFYDFTVAAAPRFRFIVLNCYGVSSLGRAADDPVAREATRRLRAVNPNANLNSPDGLDGLAERFVEFNGAVDAAQLAWLALTLARARAAAEHVVVFTHIPVHPATTHASSLLWNYDEVLGAVFAAGCVRAVFSGHSHADGYARERGVHFVVCDALLECAPHETAHGLVHVHGDRLVLQGYGKVPTRELRFPASEDAAACDA
ncbi:hypothetical protein PybrP1_001336 [[Pythium] brassicae (nom. inval.)]|nr:hypothetical protein PybrP1_001336 [[Pythium] brassicae (nom. inval.)]